MNNHLNISNLVIGYNNHILLEGINLTSQPGKMIGLLGRNGQGKSTLLKTISGLLPPISGNFNCATVDVFAISEKERAKVLSIVSTTQNNIGDITVKDFIAFGRFPYTNWLGINTNKDYNVIDNAISLCKLEILAGRNYDELSDGEKQKVNIARAIAQDTPLIILDEPTVHLDLINKLEIFKLLKELSEKHNKTIVISTHQIEYALQICDEIWMINNKEILSSTPADIINSDKLSELFNDEIISFDKNTRSFKLK